MKNEKQESPAAEILWLRGLRAFVAENSTERLLAEADALDAARAETEADKQALFLRTLTLIERGEKADFYSRVLQYAELKERGEKGGAEQAIRRHWGELQQMERGIKRRYEKLREGAADRADGGHTGDNAMAAGEKRGNAQEPAGHFTFCGAI